MSQVAHSLGWTMRTDLGATLSDALGMDTAEELPDAADESTISNRTFKEVTNLIENLTNEVHHVLVEDALIGENN
ncbi:MAG: hypothetical protein IKO43_03370 [Kiritimatiellae bacterium]|nr:hypothetical protein [Kiritimatiellia bacterium]